MNKKKKPKQQPKLQPLIPADPKRCQAEVRPGGPYSFMTLGPIPPLERCKNKADFIATEKKPGRDGRRGSMSLCWDCCVVFRERHDGARVATVKPIP